MAVNDVASVENLVYLLRYDTVYGRCEKPVASSDGELMIVRQKLRLLSIQDPAQLPWRDLRVDIVLGCTGRFTRQKDLEKHIGAGARMVILSTPSLSHQLIVARDGQEGLAFLFDAERGSGNKLSGLPSFVMLDLKPPKWMAWRFCAEFAYDHRASGGSGDNLIILLRNCRAGAGISLGSQQLDSKVHPIRGVLRRGP